MKIPQQEINRRNFQGLFIITLLVSALVAVLSYRDSNFYSTFDNNIFDLYLSSAIPSISDDRIMIADIDDSSLAAAGQWPWPRYRIASLLQTITQYSPAVIGIDIIFPEPDRTSLNTIQNTFSNEFGLNLGFTGLPDGLTDNDGFLGATISQSPVVGAKYFYFDHETRDQDCTLQPLTITGDRSLISPIAAPGILCNVNAIDNKYQYSGFINNMFDSDGFLRKAPLLMQYKGQYFPHLSLAVLAKLLGVNSIEITNDFFGPILQLDEYTIPIDQHGFFPLNFGGPGQGHHFISAVDILNQNLSPNTFFGKIVLLGTTAAGLNDLHNTAFDPSFPGIETHAVILSNVLNDQCIRIPIWQLTYTTIVSLLTIFLIAFFFYFFRPLTAALSSVSWFVLLASLSFIIFTMKSVYLSPTGPLLVSVLMIFFCSFMLYLVENKRSLNWVNQLVRVQQVTMESMAAVAETRDPETGGHINRTKRYVRVLAEYLLENKMDDGQLTEDYIDTLYHSAPLHDLGKVGIPDHILLKASGLNKEEFLTMQKHSEYGAKIINAASVKLEGNNFLGVAAEIALTHHEKWDGTGYPKGLKGKEIPISGRLMAVVDVYDALICKRHYKESFSHAKAKSIMLQGKGTHFDPTIIKAFCEIEHTFIAIAHEFEDSA